MDLKDVSYHLLRMGEDDKATHRAVTHLINALQKIKADDTGITATDTAKLLVMASFALVLENEGRQSMFDFVDFVIDVNQIYFDGAERNEAVLSEKLGFDLSELGQLDPDKG